GWCCGGRRSRPAAGLAVRRRVPATEVDSEDLTVAEKLSEFVSSRQAGWDALAGLVTSARGRVQRLDAEQVRLLGAGYRQVTADLAYARRRFGADPVTQRLEVLARDARPLVYGTVDKRDSVLEFALTGFWRRVAERP